MKNLFFVSIAFSIFSGTSLGANAQPGPKFINGIELRSSATPIASEEIVVSPANYTQPVINYLLPAAAGKLMATESCSRLQFKFAQMLGREVETLTNLSLLSFIDEWWATRYHYGGTTKDG